MPAKTVTRVDTSTGADVHVLPPRYHSAPKGGRSLVYTDFGADMLEDLAAAGLPTEVLAFETPFEDLAALLTFVSLKPAD
jgi:hypothetical protein